MRSHSSSHRSSHRSSFSRSHRSRISRNHSHSSINRNSLRHGSMHKSGIHRTSLGTRIHKSKIGGSSIRSSSFRRHGISNAHAFVVGKATGININASALGAHGATLHRLKKARDRHKITSNNIHVGHTTSHRFHRNINNKKRSDDFLKRMRVSHSKHRYTCKKTNYEDVKAYGQEVNKAMNEFSKYAWIPLVIAVLIFIFIIAFIFGTFFLIFRGIMIH